MSRTQLPHSIYILLILLFIFSNPIVAATFTVTNLSNSGAGSLRQAITDANAATGSDTIAFQSGLSGTITLTGGQLTITDNLVVNGPGAGILAINGNNASRVFEIASGKTVTLNGLTLRNGYNASHGGAIYNAGLLIINGSVLTDNRAGTISSGNVGGAISNGGSLEIHYSTLSNNVATYGGCIDNGQNPPSPLTITQSAFSNNSAYEGGCLYNSSPLTVTITGSTFSGNRSGRDGAGIFNAESAGALNIESSVFFDNTAAGSGGGVYNRATLVVKNSTLSGNAATTNDGGALWTGGNSYLTVSQSTITGNSAVVSGGGLWLYGAQTTISNSIVSGNLAPLGKEIRQDNSTAGGVFTSLGYNLIGENGSSGVSGVTLATSDRILAGPVSSALGPLSNNGGPTLTHLLVTGSRAIDSGSNALIPTGIATDQRGAGFPRIVGSTVDIGAVEAAETNSNAFIQISAGGDHTCGLKNDGAVVCWGSNQDEYGNIVGQAASHSGIFTQISAGWTHTCGLKNDGTITCWGLDSYGQATPPADIFTYVSAGGTHTCGLKSDSTVICWGTDIYGRSTPPSASFTQISSRHYHNCGVKNDNTVACWGYDGYGESTPPVDAFTQVSAGIFFSCGVKSDSTLACWGQNDQGQATPPTDAFTQVSASGPHACGLKSDSTIACWGQNDYGQAMPPAGHFIQVSAGDRHTCGLKSDGTILCWGSNEYGQLGSWAVNATHRAPPGYPAGGIVTITNELIIPAGAQLLSLGWRPTLPTGWTLQSASGDGDPEVQTDELVFVASSLTVNPLRFEYRVAVPADATGTQSMTAEAEYHLSGAPNPTTLPVLPILELTEGVSYQSADYRDPPWQIDGTEANRILAYWRAGGYQANVQGDDGYAPGTGATGMRHSADFREPYWQIDGTEANRILAYWRAGGYHVDPEGVDGYAPGLAISSMGLRSASQDSGPQATQQLQSAAQAGEILGIQVTVNHAGDLLSLLARPELPTGWTITEVTGEGSPQVLGNEILFTEQNLPNPLTFQYQVRLLATAQGVYDLHTALEYQSASMINPVTLYAAADPLSVTVTASGDDVSATTLITHYYTSILGRTPDADGLTYWQGLIADLQAQGQDVKPVFRDMADFFFNSAEYLGKNTSDAQFITDLYRTFFQREPDQGGMDFWLGQLAAEVTRNEVMAGFLYSPEFTAFMEGLGF